MQRLVQLALVGSIALLGLALFSFWPTYIGKPFAPIDGYTHAHAALGLLWLLLLVSQPLWLRLQRREVHRTVGRLAWPIGLAFIVSGLLLAHVRFSRMDAARFQSEAHWMFLPFYANLAFAACLALGFAFRHQPSVHGRFMLCTGALLIDPAMARLLGTRFPPLPWEPLYQLIGFGLTDAVMLVVLFAAPLPAMARRAAIGLVALVLTLNVGWFFFAQTAGWRAIAQAFRSLPLT
jgi:hypothetical protein